MAIAIVEELWTRIRAAIDDKIVAATDARDQAVTAKNGAVTAQTAAETAAANAATVAAAKAVEEVDKLKAGAPAAFDTLLEIANELGENETERAALTNSIAAKADAGHTHTSSGISDKTHFGGAGNADRVVGWGSDGHLYQPNDPTTDNHLARKGYVDGELTKKADTSHQHTAANITDATTVGRNVLKASDAAAARTAIGAGTSNLAIGTTAGTAKAGDWKPAAADITDATAIGQSVVKAATTAAARTAIGAGTSNLTLGTTSSTAKAGDYQPTAANITDATTVGRNVLKATDAAAARTAIGAGTSNLAIGTTASTAAAGNHTHSQYAESSRVTALEGSQPIIVSSLPASPLPGRIYLVTG